MDNLNNQNNPNTQQKQQAPHFSMGSSPNQQPPMQNLPPGHNHMMMGMPGGMFPQGLNNMNIVPNQPVPFQPLMSMQNPSNNPNSSHQPSSSVINTQGQHISHQPYPSTDQPSTNNAAFDESSSSLPASSLPASSLPASNPNTHFPSSSPHSAAPYPHNANPHQQPPTNIRPAHPYSQSSAYMNPPGNHSQGPNPGPMSNMSINLQRPPVSNPPNTNPSEQLRLQVLSGPPSTHTNPNLPPGGSGNFPVGAYPPYPAPSPTQHQPFGTQPFPSLSGGPSSSQPTQTPQNPASSHSSLSNHPIPSASSANPNPNTNPNTNTNSNSNTNTNSVPSAPTPYIMSPLQAHPHSHHPHMGFPPQFVTPPSVYNPNANTNTGGILPLPTPMVMPLILPPGTNPSSAPMPVSMPIVTPSLAPPPSVKPQTVTYDSAKVIVNQSISKSHLTISCWACGSYMKCFASIPVVKCPVCTSINPVTIHNAFSKTPFDYDFHKVMSWTVEDVIQFARMHNIDNSIQHQLKVNYVTGTQLIRLTMSDLAQWGIKSSEDAQYFLHKIAEMNYKIGEDRKKTDQQITNVSSESS